MCGQFEALLYLNLLKHQLHIDHPSDVEEALSQPAAPRKVVPGSGAPIVIENPEHGRLEVIEARFGLVPHWYRGTFRDWKAATFNARVEDAAAKRAFAGPMKYRHALVPAEAFYEWSGPKGRRTKWRITRGDNQPLAYAGLWDEAQLNEGELWSFTILTRPAGADMARIHDREPVVLPPEHWEDWLRRGPVDLQAPAPFKSQAMDDGRPPETLDLFG